MGVFNETLKEYGLGSGEKFKVQEGKNVIRVLSEPRVVLRVPGPAKHEILGLGA